MTRSFSRIRLWRTAVVITLALVLCACGAPETVVVPPTPTPQTVGGDEEIDIEGVKISLMQIQRSSDPRRSDLGRGRLEPGPGMDLAFVTFTMRPQPDAQPRTFERSMFALTGADGTRYYPRSENVFSGQLESQTVRPGLNAVGLLIFDVPTSEAELRLLCSTIPLTADEATE